MKNYNAELPIVYLKTPCPNKIVRDIFIHNQTVFMQLLTELIINDESPEYEWSKK